MKKLDKLIKAKLTNKDACEDYQFSFNNKQVKQLMREFAVYYHKKRTKKS